MLHQLLVLLLRKQFLKTSISVDTVLQVITGFVASNSRVYDIRHALRLIRQCRILRLSECYVMDRGYDANALRRLIREVLQPIRLFPHGSGTIRSLVASIEKEWSYDLTIPNIININWSKQSSQSSKESMEAISKPEYS